VRRQKSASIPSMHWSARSPCLVHCRLMYTYDPEASAGIHVGSGQVLGGVASAWGDNVDTSIGAVGMLYPRALAAAEKLWSPAASTAFFDPRDDDAMDAIERRLAQARCVLVQVQGGGAC
jgi:N-acetyl-beta-hexosaminidase